MNHLRPLWRHLFLTTPGFLKMTLPQSDVTCLLERCVQYSVVAEANMTCVVIQG